MSAKGVAGWVWRFIKSVAASRLGRLLFVVHLILVAWAIGERASPVEQPLHYYYESALLKAILVLDLPAILLAGVAVYPLTHINASPYTSSFEVWISYAAALVFASIQWWLAGYLLGLAFRRRGV